MYRWRITIVVWPHSTGKGREADQEAAGDREQEFWVDALDIEDAMRMARCFAEGLERNPAVWQAPIMGVHVGLRPQPGDARADTEWKAPAHA
jgi:hypothetical protein